MRAAHSNNIDMLRSSSAAEANTTYGKVGVKVWIYEGEVLPTKTNKEGSDK